MNLTVINEATKNVLDALPFPISIWHAQTKPEDILLAFVNKETVIRQYFINEYLNYSENIGKSFKEIFPDWDLLPESYKIHKLWHDCALGKIEKKNRLKYPSIESLDFRSSGGIYSKDFEMWIIPFAPNMAISIYVKNWVHEFEPKHQPAIVRTIIDKIDVDWKLL